MTAEQVLKQKTDYYGLTQAAIEFAMQEYAKQKCKEQREICHKNSKIERILGDTLHIVGVLTAPEPEFD